MSTTANPNPNLMGPVTTNASALLIKWGLFTCVDVLLCMEGLRKCMDWFLNSTA